MLQKLTSILLLVVFTYSFLGAGFVYNVWLFSIKKQIKQRLDIKFGDEELTVIKVMASWESNPPAEFQWLEEHEFRYRGQMYDVIRRELHGGQVWYYCYWDKAETELLDNISEYVSTYLMQEPDREKKDTFLKTFLGKTFLTVRSFIHSDLKLIFEFLSSDIIRLVTTFLEIDHPPPRPAMSI